MIKSYYKNWELNLILLLIMTIILSSLISPMYLDTYQILYSLQQTMAITSILSIGLMFIILVGEIDISIPAILAVGTVSFARLSQRNVPFLLALIIVLGFTTVAGLFNGILIVRFKLPSMAVTLGMSGVYRALALKIGGIEGFDASTFKEMYIWIGSKYLLEVIPLSLILITILLSISWIVVHKTILGRLLFSIGNNREATYLSGYNIKSIIVASYGIAGFLSGVGALVYIGQYQSARADNVANILLHVVACVALGGFSLSGGKGNVHGLILSILILGTIQNGMGLANISGPVQTLIIGIILIITIVTPVIIDNIKEILNRKNLIVIKTISVYKNLNKPVEEQVKGEKNG